MLEHFRVAEVKGFKLGKAELGKDILGGISAGDYPVDIPYILFWIVFVGRAVAGERGRWLGTQNPAVSCGMGMALFSKISVPLPLVQ